MIRGFKKKKVKTKGVCSSEPGQCIKMRSIRYYITDLLYACIIGSRKCFLYTGTFEDILKAIQYTENLDILSAQIITLGGTELQKFYYRDLVLESNRFSVFKGLFKKK